MIKAKVFKCSVLYFFNMEQRQYSNTFSENGHLYKAVHMYRELKWEMTSKEESNLAKCKIDKGRRRPNNKFMTKYDRWNQKDNEGRFQKRNFEKADTFEAHSQETEQVVKVARNGNVSKLNSDVPNAPAGRGKPGKYDEQNVELRTYYGKDEAPQIGAGVVFNK